MNSEWRFLAESLQGPSHKVNGTPCQDASAACVLGEGADSCLVACVADGAGSAKYSDSGSRTACDTIIEQATLYHREHAKFENLQETNVVDWLRLAREKIVEDAEKKATSPRQFATTLLVAIATPERCYFFQLGDGAIILGKNNLYGVVFWPQSGEYANTTNFLTEDAFEDKLEYVAAPGPFDDVALFTDGLERLALAFDTQLPHEPFCRPLFTGLRSVSNMDNLPGELRSFLNSESVNNRSDDDRSLVLASWCAGQNERAD